MDKKRKERAQYEISVIRSSVALFFLIIILSMIGNSKNSVYRVPKSAWNDIDKLNVAASIYHRNYSVWPGQREDGTFSVEDTYTALFKEGFISNKFRKMVANISRDKYFVFVPCKSEVRNNGSYFIWSQDNISENGMCLVFRYFPDDIGTVEELGNSGFTGKDVCFYEKIWDDKDVKNGNGRIFLYPGAKKEDFSSGDVDPSWDCGYQKSSGSALNYAIMLGI